MDFFGAQDRARRKTKWLVTLFFAAIGLIISAIYGLFALLIVDVPEQPMLIHYWEPELFAVVAGITLLIIGGASIGKIAALRSGGAAVAKSLGARAVSLATTDPVERQLLNVVEEMSIAAAVPMPEVFIIEEPSINAFAAGFSVHDAAVAVTRGCINQLSRDELQGVMAHEFSHILNGDMRINIRLIGPLFGLLVIAFLGQSILRASFYRSGGRNDKNQGSGLAIIGIGLLIIGYIGVFFGRLIQAAISRQREFLADSAAVQFTRNPGGIAGALKRIGFGGMGSTIQHAHTQDTAHLFFSKALAGGFATHPPLASRIKAIDPRWDGKFLPPRPKPAVAPAVGKGAKARSDVAAGLPVAAAVIAAAGQLTAQNVQRAFDQRTLIHAAVGDFLEDAERSRHLLYALILDDDLSERQRQLDFIPQLKADLDTGLILRAADAVQEWHPSLRFEALGLLTPALKQLPAQRQRAIPVNLRRLADTNGHLSLREFMVIRYLQNEIQAIDKPTGRSVLSDDLVRFAKAVSTLLAFLAFLDTDEAGEAQRDFSKAIKVFGKHAGKLVFPVVRPQVKDLDNAFAKMLGMSFSLRKSLLSAAAEIILTDGNVSADEWRALRLTAIVLDCPMPELI
jgi:Zn-dependent protease with chaperone function